MNWLDPKKTALIIVDIQFDFCAPEGISAQYGAEVSHIGKMLPYLEGFHREVKKKQIPCFFTRFINKKTGAPKNLKHLHSLKKLFPICVEGTKGAEIYELTPSPKDIIIDKQYYDGFAGTSLLRELKKNKIETLLLAGVWTDMCVDATAKRAFSEGFNVIILKDLVSTIDERMNRHKAALEDFDKYYGFVRSSTEIIELLQNS